MMDGHGGGSEYLLGQSERLLRQRDFSGSRSYAIQALQSDPNLAGAHQILAVSDILLASQTTTPICNPNDEKNPSPNYYSVLQLPSRTRDTKLIRQHFKKLLLLVHPIKRKYDSAGEAFSLIGRAWSVLLNPKKKARFDSELAECYLNRHRHHYQEEGGGNGSFWTACPYCYCVYEYESVYVDCCLRCRNCRRPFHGVAIPPPPPLLVVPGKDEYYCCLGVFPLGFLWEGENGVGGKNCAPPEGSEGCSEGRNGSENGSLYSSGDGENSSKKMANEIWENVGRMELEEGVKNCFEEKSDERDGTERQEESNVAEKRPMRRRKSIAKNAKKIMGTGNRVRRIGSMAADAGEGRLHLNVEAGNGGEGCGIGSIGEMGRGSGEGFVIDGVKYFEGEDDIFVGLDILDDGEI